MSSLSIGSKLEGLDHNPEIQKTVTLPVKTLYDTNTKSFDVYHIKLKAIRAFPSAQPFKKLEVYHDDNYSLYQPVALPLPFKKVFGYKLVEDIKYDTLNSLPHILIGVNQMESHPIQICMSREMIKLFPKIRLYRSQITNKYLISGSLGNHKDQIRGVSEIITSFSVDNTLGAIKTIPSDNIPPYQMYQNSDQINEILQELDEYDVEDIMRAGNIPTKILPRPSYSERFRNTDNQPVLNQVYLDSHDHPNEENYDQIISTTTSKAQEEG